MNIKGMDLTKPNSYATVVISEDPLGFLVTFPYNKKLFAKLINIPGALFGDESPFPGMFFIPRNQYGRLRKELGKSAVWRSKEDLNKDRYYLTQEQETLQDVLLRSNKNIDTSFMKIQPYSFQKLGVAWASEPKGKNQSVVGGLLADEMGTGKTIQGIATACYLKSQNKIKNCLVICLATLKTQWQQEIERFTNEESIVIRTTSNKNTFESRKKLFDKVRKEKPFFTIINYELLREKEVVDVIKLKGKTKSGKQKTKKVYGDFLDLNEIIDIGYDMVIIDEAHYMKNPDTQIAQAIRKIDAKYKLLMTGTPIEKELKDAFQLFDYIDPSILTSSEIKDFEVRRKLFEEQYLLKRINPFTYPIRNIEVFGEKNTEIFRQKISPFLLRRRTEDVSDELPDLVEQKIVVDFADYQWELYKKVNKEMKQMKENLKNAKTDEEREIIDNQFKAYSQMRTIICDSPSILLQSKSPVARKIIGKRKSFPKVPKLERFLELIEDICFENNQKVVVFTRYARVADFLGLEVEKLFKRKAKELKRDPYKLFIYKGSTKPGCKLRDLYEKEGKDKSKAICSECPLYDECETRTKYAWHFQNDDNTKVLIATDAGNAGVNLQKGKYLINYDLPDSFSVFLQRNGRIRRLGSEHDKVIVYNLVTKGGIDEKKLEAIKKQMKINDRVIENKEEEKNAIKKADEFLSSVLDDV